MLIIHKQMKKLSLVAACSILLWYSCIKSNKSDLTPDANISATVDGVNENFTLNDSVSYDGTYGVYIAGTNPVNKDRIILYPWKVDGTLDPGTYWSDSLGMPNARSAQMMLIDNRDSTKYANTGPYYTFKNYRDVDYSGSITITAVTDSVIQGTFAGSVVLVKAVVHGTEPASKTITNGKFNIKIHHAH